MELTVGLILKAEPVPAKVTPHEPEYHFQIPPVPDKPPLTVNVEPEPPMQIPVGLAVIDVGVTEVSLIDTYFEVTAPTPQVFEGITDTNPEIEPATNVTEHDVLFPVHPAGADHV